MPKRTSPKKKKIKNSRLPHKVAGRAVKHVHAKAKPHAKRAHKWYKSRKFWHKIIIWILILLMLWVGFMYAVARWYIASTGNKALEVGVTFIPRYAKSFDLDPKETMQAMIDDLGVRHFRLVSYWDEFEKKPGEYNFDELDWQFDKVEAARGKVSLAIGLRQPRWPECHIPAWAERLPKEEWSAHLKDYMKVVIERYKDRPSLKNYQLENEFFMKVFGICPDHSRERLVDEFNFVKQLDPSKPVIVSRSNNAVGIPIGQPRPDDFGVSIYKRVWDKTLTKRYVEYPFPAWYYGFLAGIQKIVTGQDMIIHELQAEPWTPTNIHEASLEEQDKSINPERLRDRFEYGRATGMKEMYLWGAEWWYWRKVKHNDPGVWNVAKEEIARLSSSPNNCGAAYYDTYEVPPC